MIRKISLPLVILACGIIVQANIILCYSLTRIYTLGASAFDIGAYSQVLHNIQTYGAAVSTLQPSGSESSWLGFHFTPLLYLLAPLNHFIPSPLLLEIVQTLAVSLAAIPVYLAARALGLERRYACAGAFAYLFNPFTLNGGIWGFQEFSMTTLWLAIALWAIAAKRFYWLLAACALMLLTKEHYGISVCMLGFMWWHKHGDKKRGLALAGGGVIALLLVMLVITPYFRGSFMHPMLRPDALTHNFNWLLSADGWSKHAQEVVVLNIKYITLLLLFFFFLPVAGAFWLLGGASDFLVALASSYYLYKSPFCCYSLPMMPAVTIAACAGFQKLRAHVRSPALPVGMVLLAIPMYVYLACLPIPLAVNMMEFHGAPQFALSQKNAAAVSAINALVPADATLGTQDNIGMFFITHRALYVFPAPSPQLDYVVAYLQSPTMYAPFYMSPYGTPVYFKALDKLLKNPEWKIIYWQRPWILLSRTGAEIPDARADVNDAFQRFTEQQYALQILFQNALTEYEDKQLK